MTARSTPEYVNDLFSSFYPPGSHFPCWHDWVCTARSLRWTSHAAPQAAGPPPTPPLLDGSCAVLDRDRSATAAGLDRFAPGDGDGWLGLCRIWDQLGDEITRALFSPFPPVRSGAVLAARLRAAGGLRLARSLLLPVRRLGEEEFDGQGGRLLLAGNALHADLSPEAAGSGGFGWLMSMLGQSLGFPVPVGGAGALTTALVRRLEGRGGSVRCGHRVTEIVVRQGRAVGVRTESGEAIPARRAVLADVSAPSLYGSLVASEHLPGRLLDDMRRFQWDFATFKVDWALNGPIPWSNAAAASAGTVHLAEGVDELTRFASQIARGLVPDRPFLLMGQMTTADASRSPRDTESAWAYTHVPHTVKADAGAEGLTGAWNGGESERMADRVEQQVERYAPGFRSRIRARRILTPLSLQAADANLHNGAINAGTASIHQQLVFRPVPGTGRPETPVRGLYLASASAHPGGGVHGAPGANAARAAIRSTRVTAHALTSAQRLLARRDRAGRPRAT
ncbi:Pyridine nucleotide-disulfide oxidoreductase domain-containing protein 2 OS=Streptomyces cyaneofuscatus OX=66883 GN=G3I52_00810 PE=4 SV=1 [Streptomyces cyaneofuscatus]